MLWADCSPRAWIAGLHDLAYVSSLGVSTVFLKRHGFKVSGCLGFRSVQCGVQTSSLRQCSGLRVWNDLLSETGDGCSSLLRTWRSAGGRIRGAKFKRTPEQEQGSR